MSDELEAISKKEEGLQPWLMLRLAKQGAWQRVKIILYQNRYPDHPD